MPINNIKQPETISVSDNIRLRKFYASYDFTFPWYQDENTVYLMDGVKRKYTDDDIENMYRWLDSHGELYFIEINDTGNFRPIGDVTFSDEDIMIVIGDVSYRKMGIGRKVLLRLIERAKELGFNTLTVKDIYDFNIPSQRCFMSVGFRKKSKTEKGSSYEIDLSEADQRCEAGRKNESAR